MGTLFDQSARNYKSVEVNDLQNYLACVKKTARDYELTVDQVLKATEILELNRRNNLYVSNGDAWDEQIAGIGELIIKISDSLDGLSSYVDMGLQSLSTSVDNLEFKNDK